MEEKVAMDQYSKPKFKRTKYLIATKFQLRYVGIILLLMSVTAIVCSYVIYYTVMVLMGEKLANVYPQGRLIAIINTVNMRIVLSLLFITPVVTIIGIYLSHKIAGPIYRIESFLGDMTAGNLASRIVLRKGDELMSVADKINTLSISLKTTMTDQKLAIERISAGLEDIKKGVDSKQCDPLMLDGKIENLRNEIKTLGSQLAKYKI